LKYDEGDDLDKKTAQAAFDMATGGVAERAGARVIKPYGMDDDTFNKSVDMQLEGMAKNSKIPVSQLEDMPMMPVPGKEGMYYLLNAGRVQLDPDTQQPITVIVK